MKELQLLVGVRAGLERVHTIIVREKADGTLHLMGENRTRAFVQEADQSILVERVRQSILEAIEDAQVSLTDILTIGVASPGQIDLDNGVIMFSTRFHPRNVPLAAELQHYFNRPISLINIVDAQAMGERHQGVGKDVNNLFYAHVAHYIGASIVIDGKIYLGADHIRNEFGHMIFNPDGPKCVCGHYGCLEMLSSGLAIEQKLRYLIGQGQTTVLADILSKVQPDLNGDRIAEAINQGDTLTIDIVTEAAEVFGIAIANVINFLNPQMIVLSGDLVDEVDLFYETAIASARRRTLYTDARNIDIVQGILGTTAGAYGAALYAKQRLELVDSALFIKG